MTFLYQYYRHLDHALDALVNKRLHFSAPSSFNDPFDCQPKFSLLHCRNEPEEVWRRYFSFLARRERPGISNEEAQKCADAAIGRELHRDKEWLSSANEEIRKTLSSISLRVSCFSKSPRNAMMWAHYADKHKGVVLQFRKASMIDGVGLYKGVDVTYYSQHIPLERYVKAMEDTEQGDDTAFARLNLCSKSIEWESEDEVRFFSNSEYIEGFPEEMFTGILLGCKAPPHLNDIIIAILSGWSSKPMVFKEDPSISSIKLCFRCIHS